MLIIDCDVKLDADMMVKVYEWWVSVGKYGVSELESDPSFIVVCPDPNWCDVDILEKLGVGDVV